MKCWICGKEMENTRGGCYYCKDCGTGIDDAVFRKNTIVDSHLEVIGGYYQQGWVCPKCGGVYSPYQGCCPNCTPAKPIQWTCDTGNPNTPTGQSISVVGNGIDTSDRMNNFK